MTKASVAVGGHSVICWVFERCEAENDVVYLPIRIQYPLLNICENSTRQRANLVMSMSFKLGLETIAQLQ